MNLPLPNHHPSKHRTRHISITVHPHLIHTHYHPQHILLMVSMELHPIHHLIPYHQTTTVMVLLDHHENITMINSNIKIFFMIDFFFIWLLLVDNSNYHLRVILHHQMVYGVQHFVLLLVSTKFFLSFLIGKIHRNSIFSIFVTCLVTSNYNRFMAIALTFLFSHSLPHILQLKVKMCINTHTHTSIIESRPYTRIV